VLIALGAAGDYRDIIWLLVLLGQRKNEIGALRWAEIDLDRAVVTLPPSRTKNRKGHSFPLSAPALAILQRRWDARSDDRELVFGRGKGANGFSGWSDAKDRLDAALKLPAFVVHDLRRSFSSGLGDLGVPPHVIEMLINHQSGAKAGVSGRYNLSRYEREGRQAVELWAATVMAAVEGRAGTIVSLHRAG
jgi:integrase